MPVAMRIHSVQGGKTPGIDYLGQTNGQTFIAGAILVFAAGLVSEGGVNPTGIVGVAAQPADSSPGFNLANSNQVNTVTGRSQKVSVFRPNDQTIFMATLTNNSNATVVPVQADVGSQYGLTAYSGIWTVDKNKTAGNARVTVVGFDASLYGGVVFFKFLASSLA